MRRTRSLIVIALAAASIGVGAAPASAVVCTEEVPQCCANSPVNVLWRKLTGNDLYVCW